MDGFSGEFDQEREYEHSFVFAISIMSDLEGNASESSSSPRPVGSPGRPLNANANAIEVNYKRFPIFILLVAATNCFLYFYGIIFIIEHAQVTFTSPVSPPISSWYFYTITNYPSCSDVRGHPVRAFMYQFVHASITHLGGNIFAALTYGVLFNTYSGSALLATGVIYETAVFMGGLGHSLVWPYKGLIGCSPGVYGMIGACWVLFFFDRYKLPPMVAFILPFVLCGQLFGDVTSYLLMFSSDIGYVSHFFGFYTGLTLALGLLLWNSQRTDTVRLVAGALGICAFALQAYFLLSYSHRTGPPEPFRRPFLHNMDYASCCAQLFSYAQENGESMSTARAATQCQNDVLYPYYSSY